MLRSLAFLGLCVGLAGCAGLPKADCGAAPQPKASPPSESAQAQIPVLLGAVPNELAANRFMLLDRSGNPRGYLGLRPRRIHGLTGNRGVDGDEWGFALWDRNAIARVEYGFREEGAAELIFRDPAGEVRASLVIGAGGETRLTVTDPGGKSRTLP